MPTVAEDAVVPNDDDDEDDFKEKVTILSGLELAEDYLTYRPHVELMTEKYDSLRESRAEQRKYVVDRILTIHRIHEVR